VKRKICNEHRMPQFVLCKWKFEFSARALEILSNPLP
jgi:hypothetical protein